MAADGVISEKLNPTAAVAPQIYVHVREAIMRSKLAPGDRISESEIARAYAVSRQPVREAFLRLAADGLLEILPQRGTVITKIDYAAVIDARFLREAIEADLVSILASAPNAKFIEDLRSQIQAQKTAAKDNPQAFPELDECFHRTLAYAAGKRGAWKLIEGLISQMDRVRFLAADQFPVEKLIMQHTNLVDRIEAGDCKGANLAIRSHLREVLTDLPKIRAAKPEFFELPDDENVEPVNVPIQGGEKK